MAPSPFLDPGTHSAADQLGILQLRRDHLIPALLAPDAHSDYAEGRVENTRFGSFPHSTLVGQPWGTQILASRVDTGSRGRNKKRKAPADDTTTPADSNPDSPAAPVQQPVKPAAVAASGFAHLVPPTPETWTLSLPHRTQVVYTPDSSYILQRLRVRPGDHLIEAGAGSGSFTHASARAVYNAGHSSTRRGAVYSFEYHEPRAAQLRAELADHALSDTVTVTHRDVYADGFNVPDGGPHADAVFLDLPAPWQALPHLTRGPASPLNPRTAVRICTFSPCIEQVTKTVAAMRTLGWLEIDMVEIQAKRFDVRRERVGLSEEGTRGGNATAASVAEAVQRLRDVEGRAAVFHVLQKEKSDSAARRNGGANSNNSDDDADDDIPQPPRTQAPLSKQARIEAARREGVGRPLWKEGRLVHRTEAELKTHTSYLVFAVLPRAWTAEDEERARAKVAKGGKK
jgi:tRNA (adenine57-N1/adenine58-N1)-methyltransferase